MPDPQAPPSSSAPGWTPVDEPPGWTPVQGAPPSTPATPATFSPEWWQTQRRSAGQAAIESLPALGATAGGILGAPGGGVGAIPGAALGGAFGEAARIEARKLLGQDAPDKAVDQLTDVFKQGALQGVIQAMTEGLGKVAPMLHDAAVAQYTKALAPAGAENKMIAQQVAPQLLQENVTGSLPSIAKQMEQRMATTAPQLNAAYDVLQTQQPTISDAGTELLGALQDVKSRYIIGGQIARPEAVGAINSVQDIVQQYGPDISPKNLRALKANFADPVAQAGGYTTAADLTSRFQLQAEKTAANEIRSILHSASPDVARLDAAYSFARDARDLAQAGALRQTGQEGGIGKALTPLVAGAAGALGGYAAHGVTAGAEVGGGTALVTMVGYAMRQPAWRTMSAVTKDAVASALARGDVQAVTGLLLRSGVALAREASSPTGQTSPTIPLGPQ